MQRRKSMVWETYRKYSVRVFTVFLYVIPLSIFCNVDLVVMNCFSLYLSCIYYSINFEK